MWLQETPWRVELGERLLAAIVGRLTSEACDGFELFGDSTWCNKAMQGKDVLALSYGIEERDMWSEKMSTVYGMRTKLFDCFIPPFRSPAIGGTAPNATSDCSNAPGPCYRMPYEPYRICLGPEKKVINSRPYETLLDHLAGRPPLSTHVKIDSEGTEWAVLERLLESPVDQDKIRTLEMEVHFSFVPEGDDPEARTLSERERLQRRVNIMERLLERFVVSGSGLEVYRQEENDPRNCPQSRCHEPVIHLPAGMGLDQFAISYVHKALVGQTPAGVAAAVFGAASAALAAPTPAPAPVVGGWPGGIDLQAMLDNPCRETSRSMSNRPGVPCMQRTRENPYKTDTPWRAEFGERVLRAVTGRVTEEDCDGLELFGDSAWCLRALKQPDVLGFSYGIEERDLWSEKMSNIFKIPTRLYDCFIPPARSPPIAKTAPNATGSCEGVGGHCYETPYDSFRICLGPQHKTINGRPYETLADHLAGRQALSTHLKIDSEGTEWAILERFLASKEDQDKVRTLDMEVHFSMVPEGDDPTAKSKPERERLEQRVRIMEGLLDRFVCTGSTLEVYQNGWSLEEKCRNKCPEPSIHLVHGIDIDQFAVSYVHRDLLPAGFVPSTASGARRLARPLVV